MYKYSKKNNLFAMLLFVIFSGYAFADCNIKKATVNKVVENRIGVSGSCDAKLAVENKIEKSTKTVKVAKEIKEHRDHKQVKDKTVKNKIKKQNSN